MNNPSKPLRPSATILACLGLVPCLLAQPAPRVRADAPVMFSSLEGVPVVDAEGQVVGSFADLEVQADGRVANLVVGVRQKTSSKATKTRRVPFASVRYSAKSTRFELAPPPEKPAKVKSAVIPVHPVTALASASVTLDPAPADAEKKAGAFGRVTHAWVDLSAGRMVFVGVTAKVARGQADERLAPWSVLRVVPSRPAKDAPPVLSLTAPPQLATAPRTKATILRGPAGRQRVHQHYKPSTEKKKAPKTPGAEVRRR